MFQVKQLTVAFLALLAFAGLVSAIQPAPGYSFGPCGSPYYPQGGLGVMRYNQCYDNLTFNNMTQGRYCDSKGNYIYNCSVDTCPCLEGYYCSSSGTCDFCSAGEACFTSSESGLDSALSDFMGFLPTMFPLLLFFGIGLVVFLLVEMVRHIDEYG